MRTWINKISILTSFQSDTELHSWEVLAEIISDPMCKDMLIDLGMGVRHKNVQYNSRVICTYRKIVGIRTKQGDTKAL